MKATYNVTGDKRKALVRIISEVIGMKPVYMRMPTCAYVIAGITVEKDGAVVWDERTDDTTIEAVKAALSDAGFTAEEDTRPEVASNECEARCCPWQTESRTEGKSAHGSDHFYDPGH